MIQPTYSPVEALNRVKLMMGYDPTKTLTENEKSVKGLIKEDDIDTDTEKSIQKVLQRCSGVDSIGTLDAASIATAFNRAFNYQTMGFMGGTDDSLWRAQAQKMKKGNLNDLCNIKNEFEELGFGDFAQKLVDELDDEELAELMETFASMSYKTKTEREVKADSTEQKNINEFIAKFKCVFNTQSNIDSSVHYDKNRFTFIKVKGNSGQTYLLYYDGALKKWSPSKNMWIESGKFLRCNGREVVVESTEKKRLIEDFDDSGLGGTRTPSPTSTPRPNPTPRPTYRTCSGTYTKGCKTDMSGAIAKVQACLKIGVDGKYGKNTDLKLKSLGFSSFTDADVDKLCNVPAPEISGEITKIDPSNTDF